MWIIKFLFYPATAGFLGGLLAGAGSVVGGLLGFGAQKDTNDTNAALARENREWMTEENLKQRDFNAAQAVLDRDFQSQQAGLGRDFTERLSNTAFRRAVNDMRSAGLNPMLLAAPGGHPASTPQAATATGSRAAASSTGAPNLPAMQSAFASAAGAAGAVSQAMRTVAETDNIRAQNANIRAQTANINADTGEKLAGTGLKNLQSDLVTKETTHTEAKIQKVFQEIQSLQQDMITSGTTAEKNRRMTELLTTQLPRALNEAAMEDTIYKRYVSPFLPDILKSTSIIKGVLK